VAAISSATCSNDQQPVRLFSSRIQLKCTFENILPTVDSALFDEQATQAHECGDMEQGHSLAGRLDPVLVLILGQERPDVQVEGALETAGVVILEARLEGATKGLRVYPGAFRVETQQIVI
jgi:hypothetical protein